MYPGTREPLSEGTRFRPNGPKGVARAVTANLVLSAIGQQRVQAMICRAPEFYGPPGTKSLTNKLVFDRIRAGKRPFVPVSAHTKRSLIWVPDAARATALLGNTPDAYGQTWHLPIDASRATYHELIALAATQSGRKTNYTVVPAKAFTLVGTVAQPMREVRELLPRYATDNVFDCTKFKERFPHFQVTPLQRGVTSALGMG